jgi:hypothetical protein
MKIYVVSWEADDSADGYVRQYFSSRRDAIYCAKQVMKDEVEDCVLDRIGYEKSADVYQLEFKKPTSAKAIAEFRNGIGVNMTEVGSVTGVVVVKETDDDWIVESAGIEWLEKNNESL